MQSLARLDLRGLRDELWLGRKHNFNPLQRYSILRTRTSSKISKIIAHA